MTLHIVDLLQVRFRCLVHRFRGDPSGWQQTDTPHITKNSTPFSILIFSFLFRNYTTGWWERQTDIITSTWTHWKKDSPTAWCDCSRNIFIFVNSCAHGARSECYVERLLVDTSTVLRCLIFRNPLSSVSVSPLSLAAPFFSQPERPWQDRWHLWPTVENYNYIWQAQWFIDQILQTSWAFSSWWNCAFKF